MFVVDTNVLSELMRPKPNFSVVAWIGSHPKETLFTTAISQAEIQVGISILPPGRKREALLTAANILFQKKFLGRVLAFDTLAANAFASLIATRKSGGRPISLFDAQIAAIVQARNANLVTRNVSDFADCGFDVIDPWRLV